MIPRIRGLSGKVSYGDFVRAFLRPGGGVWDFWGRAAFSFRCSALLMASEMVRMAFSARDWISGRASGRVERISTAQMAQMWVSTAPSWRRTEAMRCLVSMKGRRRGCRQRGQGPFSFISMGSRVNHQCFECGRPARHAHHVVPASEGGTRTVPLCERCHGKVHDQDFYRHCVLIRKGLARARAAGKRLGRRRCEVSEEQFAAVAGFSTRLAAQQLGVSHTVVSRWRSRQQPSGNDQTGEKRDFGPVLGAV
jgi:hypothetical protein